MRPRTAGLASLALLCLAGCAPPPSTVVESAVTPKGATAPAADTTLVLPDASGPGAPVPFASVRVPAGWRGEGGISPPTAVPPARDPVLQPTGLAVPDCRMDPFACLAWHARLPDGSQGMELQPTAFLQLDVGQLRTIGTADGAMTRFLLLDLAQARHPDARVVSFAPAALPGPSVDAPGGGRWETGTLVIAYRAQGRDMREESTTLLLIGAAMDGAVPVSRGVTTFLHAPSAEFATLDRVGIRASMRIDPAWQARVAQEADARARRERDYSCRYAQMLDNPACDPLPGEQGTRSDRIIRSMAAAPSSP